ncbi:MAG TPA: phosphoglycerate dehydrogenase [Gammaproteobacteria bacterium]|nr:phosphoglycerate dehydrogenase [Gammaproteobacteria bacterium]
MFKVQTFNKIAAAGLNQFPKELYEVSSDIQQPDAILVRSQPLHDLKVQDSLKIIGRAGAGVNNIPVAAMTQIGIPVLCTPGANANAVSELVLAGMLLASRNICQAWEYVKYLEGNDAQLNDDIELNKKRFIGNELLGKTLGIVGLGSIGVRVANAAIHLGMQVIGFDPTITVNRAWQLSSNVIQAHSLEELLSQSDYVTLHVPLLPATKKMMNAEKLKLMKPTAVLLNFARDAIVDNEALVQLLNQQKIKNYVSDFPSQILLQHPAVISLPHLGASTMEAEENCAVMLVRQMRAFLETGAIMNSVNFPDVDVPQNYNGVRIAVVNANVPNMVAQISAKLAEAKLNILGLTNKSREEIAYTLLDIEGGVAAGVLKEIAAIDGVKHVRKIIV